MKLGLALSGGGIRGIAHAGALKALEDNNIKIDIIVGTSIPSDNSLVLKYKVDSSSVLKLL